MSKRVDSFDSFSLIKIGPYSFFHVFDHNTNITRVECGPQRLTLQGHEKVVGGPFNMISIPPFSYCMILNPVVRDEAKRVVLDQFGQAKHSHGDKEVRFSQDPFPLYPLEELYEDVRELRVLTTEHDALVLRADHDTTELVKTDEGEVAIQKEAGEEWLFRGPGTYYPNAKVSITREIRAIVINPETGIHLRATKNLVDQKGIKRLAGEEWCVAEPGPFLPGIGEEVVKVVPGSVLTSTKALHLRAKVTFVDVYGKHREAGKEWLVTNKMSPIHILGVYEEKVADVAATILTSSQYCVVENPVVDGETKLGERVLLIGPLVKFMEPKEVVKKIADVRVLNEDEAFYVRATEEFSDDGKKRKPGDRWLVTGPLRYWPPLEVEILEQKKAIFFVEGFPLVRFFTFSQVFLTILFVVLLAVLVPQLLHKALSR